MGIPTKLLWQGCCQSWMFKAEHRQRLQSSQAENLHAAHGQTPKSRIAAPSLLDKNKKIMISHRSLSKGLNKQGMVCLPLVPALGSPKQKGPEFKGILIYIERSSQPSERKDGQGLNTHPLAKIRAQALLLNFKAFLSTSDPVRPWITGGLACVGTPTLTSTIPLTTMSNLS